MRLRDWSLIGVAVGVGGWYLADDVLAMQHEHDLSRLGQGVPSVVQIHDPNCPTCLALQKQVKRAMEAFDSQELQYLVANIRTPEGRSLATEHGVPHVTLLLFDGEGRRKQILRGPNTATVLEREFRRHVAAGRNS